MYFCTIRQYRNSLTRGKDGSYHKYVISKQILITQETAANVISVIKDILSISNEVVIRLISQGLICDKGNIDTGKGLETSGNKPLPEWIFAKFYDVKWHQQRSVC